MNPSSPESIIASARALAAMGSHREAECMLRGALARLPEHGAFRLALMGLSIDAAAGSWPPMSILHVERWIRDGMLVEALAALSGCSFGEDGQRWAHLLGELLAPPPDSSQENASVHQSLLRGGASVAMTTLEDLSRAAPLEPWAARRLQLLRWMLIDNAQSAPRDSQVDVLASPLAKALFETLEARDLAGMARAAEGVDHPDAQATAQALDRLAREANKQCSPESADKRTVQHMGRAAAAMQLHMTAFESARAVYERMLTKAAEPEVAQLLVAVQGVERVLIGRPFNQRIFSAPKASKFEDVTAYHAEQRALASTPAAIGGTHEGMGFDDQTRVAASAEIPLAAFGDEITRAIVLPEAANAADGLDESPRAEGGFEDVTAPHPLKTAQMPVRAPSSFSDDVTLPVSDVANAFGAPTAPAGTLEPEAFGVRATQVAPDPLLHTVSAEQTPQEPSEGPNRNSVIITAIVPVGVEKTR